MSLFFRVIEKSDFDELQEFENRKLKEIHSDEIEMSMARWESRWRPESMEFYLQTGWCFLVRNKEVESAASQEGQLLGYFLAQPLTFLDGQTQSLWIEHISYSTLEARDRLCELAQQLCREKHLQKVYFPNQSSILNSINTMKPSPWNPSVYQVYTTKVSQ